jgi:hypothetical protein
MVGAFLSDPGLLPAFLAGRPLPVE